MKKLTATLLLFSFSTFAQAHGMVYFAADVGIFQANFNQSYLDQTDVISQNIAQPIQQNAYTGGIAVGYSHPWKSNYFLGAELSGNIEGHQGLFQTGASTSAFSDATKIQNHFDLVFVPGILLS